MYFFSTCYHGSFYSLLRGFKFFLYINLLQIPTVLPVILPVLRRLILFLLPFAQPPPVQASNSYHVLIYRFFCHRICFSFFFGELQIPLALQFIAIFFLHSLQFFFLLLLLFLLLPLPDFFSTGFAAFFDRL